MTVRGDGPAVAWSDAVEYVTQYAAQDDVPSCDEFHGAGWWYDPEEWDTIVAE